MSSLPAFTGRIRHLDMEVGIPLCVTLEEIERQRDVGWPDWHPEDFCHRCWNRNISWATPADVWDPVMRGGDHGSFGPWGEIICIPCFIELSGPGKAWTLAYDENGTTILALLPQRVAPSEEEVRHAIATSYPTTEKARAVAALFASQLTVAEVRAQALKDGAAKLREYERQADEASRGQSDPAWSRLSGMAFAHGHDAHWLEQAAEHGEA